MVTMFHRVAPKRASPLPIGALEWRKHESAPLGEVDMQRGIRIRLVTLLAAIALPLASGAASTNPRQLLQGVPATDVRMESLLLREDIAVPATTAETEEPIRAAGFLEPTQVTPTLRNLSGDSGSAAEVLALLGFLVLIAGLLIHWSRDTSCKDERSVFPS